MRPDLNRLARRAAASLGVLSMAFVGLVASPAAADTAPADVTLPQTVTSDVLPTAQIDGIAWDQKIAGNTVYVGGRFSSVRPAGAAPGVSTVPRSNMMAYDIRTGQYTGFAPTFNAQVRAVAISPDGTRVYAAGEFTSVNGTSVYRVAAFSTATGALITSFRPVVNARIASIAVTDTTVYLGGIFSTVNGQPRNRVAAVSAANGAVLPSVGSADDGAVNALVLSPDGSQLVVGGSFTTFNASAKPGYGLARVDTATGQMLPLPANDLIRNGGANSSITSLSTDADTFYGSGYHFGAGGNLEGTFAARWTDGGIVWVEDCHGDTYQSTPIGDVVYSASHKHYCGNIGGFPETNPRSFYRATATTKAVRGTATKDPHGYFNYAGSPTPQLLNWFPAMDTGSISGSNQGPWAVAGNSQYVVMSGEFNRVNNVGQQGLVRFAVPAIAPNRDGPRLAGAAFNPRLRSVTPGEVRITWPANWDRDNATLTYRLYRTSSTTPPIFEQTVTAPFWSAKDGTFVDSGLEPGSTQRYRVTATDPRGNTVQSEFVTVTVASAETADAYAGEVLADGAASYWRLGEPSGTTVADWAGLRDATARAGVTRGTSGAVPRDAASSFDGTTAGFVSTTTAAPSPSTFTVEAWVNTTSTTGGKIIGYGSSSTANSSSYDRHVYMDNTGRIVFGVHPGSVRTVVSTGSFNDGQWHHVAASLGTNGMRLYVDGKLVAQRTDTTTGQATYNGFWRIGGDTIGTNWTSSPTSKYLAGAIDEVAVYPGVLAHEDVLDHYLASGRTSTLPAKPADAYGAAVREAGPDLYWRFGEALGTQAADTGLAGVTGTYRSGVTLGAEGPRASGGTTALSLDGLDDYVSSDTSVVNPRVYSEELWFSTTTTRGGRLIGLGSGKDTSSTTYDRQVYMLADGRLSFGTWTGVQNVLTSSASYNDGGWHHVVAAQSSEGMRLYVDGVLVAQNAVSGAQSYTGYWRVGADRSWGPQPGFDGRVDEAAIYSRALSAQTVAEHYSLGSTAAPANALPTAAFTSAVRDLAVDLDASASTDTDGTLAAYAWDFGDGTTGTGRTVSRTYTAAGTYTVRLTVTDDAGGTASTTQSVTVTAPPAANGAPTAAFTSSAQGLALSVDGSGSRDTDGTVASYAWDFGDGGTATGQTASRTYAAAGTYTVRLTVTDDDGATATTSQEVTVTAPPAANLAPTAAFTSSAQGLALSVDGSGSRDTDGTVASYAWDFGDGGTATGPTASRTYAAAGTYTVRLTVTDDDGATGTQTATVTVTAPAAAALAQDAFRRTVTGGWGTADVGGPWTTTNSASLYSVDGNVGRQRIGAGVTVSAALGGTSATDTEVQVKVALDKLANGGGTQAWVVGRQVGSSDYRARVRVNADATVDLSTMRGGTALSTVRVAGLTYAAGDLLQVRLQVTGTAPTTIRAKVWKVGQAEPSDWQRTSTDSTAGLQTAGGIGVGAYLSGSATNGPVVAGWDGLWAGPTAGAPPVD